MPKPSVNNPIVATLSPNGAVLVLQTSAAYVLPIEKTTAFYDQLRGFGAYSIKSVAAADYLVMFKPPITETAANQIRVIWCDLAEDNVAEVVT